MGDTYYGYIRDISLPVNIWIVSGFLWAQLRSIISRLAKSNLQALDRKSWPVAKVVFN